MNWNLPPLEMWMAMALAWFIVFVGALAVLLFKKNRKAFSVFVDTPSEGSLILHPICKKKPDHNLLVLLAWVLALTSLLLLVYPMIRKLS